MYLIVASDFVCSHYYIFLNQCFGFPIHRQWPWWQWWTSITSMYWHRLITGADPGFQVRGGGGGGAHLKKLRRAEGCAKIVGVFRVKNHVFTPKNHIFSNFRGGGGGGGAPGAPLDPPLNNVYSILKYFLLIVWLVFTIFEKCMFYLGNGWLYLATRTILVWNGLPLARVLWLTRQHYRKTVTSGEDNNIILLCTICYL